MASSTQTAKVPERRSSEAPRAPRTAQRPEAKPSKFVIKVMGSVPI